MIQRVKYGREREKGQDRAICHPCGKHACGVVLCIWPSNDAFTATAPAAAAAVLTSSETHARRVAPLFGEGVTSSLPTGSSTRRCRGWGGAAEATTWLRRCHRCQQNHLAHRAHALAPCTVRGPRRQTQGHRTSVADGPRELRRREQLAPC
jgi:hypothetical protein